MECLTLFPLCTDSGVQMICVRSINVIPGITAHNYGLPVLSLFALIHTGESRALRSERPCSLKRIFSYCWFCIRKWETTNFRTCCMAKIKAPMVISDLMQRFQAVHNLWLKRKRKKMVISFLGDSKNNALKVFNYCTHQKQYSTHPTPDVKLWSLFCVMLTDSVNPSTKCKAGFKFKIQKLHFI